MEKLFNDSETFQKERPTKATDKQLELFYINMANEIIKSGYCKKDSDSIIEDLKELYPFYDSGFEMAKELDLKYGYDIDSSFIEWLESLSSSLDDLIKINVRDWVKALDIKPKFKKGTKLMINNNLDRDFKSGMKVYVTNEPTDTAVYWINADPKKYGGRVLPYELVESNCEAISNPPNPDEIK